MPRPVPFVLPSRIAPRDAWKAAVAVLLAASAGLGAPCPAAADCEESSPSPGVVVRQCAETSLAWAEVVADLGTADAAVRVSAPSERGRSAPQWIEGVDGVVLAAPGGAFGFPEYTPAGLTVGAGTRWDQTADDARQGLLALDMRQVGRVVDPERVVPFEPWMANVVSGRAVLRDGTPVRPCEGDGCERKPRAAVGLSEDGRRVVLVIVRGWSADSAGVTDPELGAMAADAGAYDAIRTGEGATSGLWSTDGAVVPSSDGSSRPGAAWLGIVDVRSGITTRIQGVVKESTDPETPLVDARITLETLDGREVANFGTVSDEAYFERSVPAREYIIRARLAGYETGCKYCPATSGDLIWCSVLMLPGDGAAECRPPPRELDAGPWPVGGDASVADAGPDGAAADADVDGGRDDLGKSSCAVSRGRLPASGLVVAAAALLALAARNRRGLW